MIVISGIGCVLPVGTKSSTLLSVLDTGQNCFQILPELQNLRAKSASLVSEVPLPEEITLGKRRRWNKLSKFFLSAAHLVLQDYGPHSWSPEKMGLVISTSHGSIESCQNYHQALLEYPQHVSPTLFSEGGLNAGSAHISIEFNIRGMLQSLSGDEEVGARAILMAQRLLQNDSQKVLLAGGGHEWCRELHQIYDQLSFGKLRLGEGAVLLALESEQSARQRQHSPYCQLEGGFDFHGNSVETLYPKLCSFLQKHQIAPENLELLISNQNGSSKTPCFHTLFPFFSKTKHLEPLKQFGESFACSSALLVALGALFLSQKRYKNALVFCESIRGNGVALLLSSIPEKS